MPTICLFVLQSLASNGARGLSVAVHVSKPHSEAVFLAEMAAIAERRDAEAFARLFVHYAPRIKGYLKRLGLDDAAAEDLAQDVMLTVWRRADQFDPARAALSTWIYAIARNRRIDVLRRERHPEPDPMLAPIPLPRGDEALEGEETRARVKEAVALLPPEQAEVLRVFYFEDESHGTIAEAFGLPLGTVKSRLRLALAKLRAILDDLA